MTRGSFATGSKAPTLPQSLGGRGALSLQAYSPRDVSQVFVKDISRSKSWQGAYLASKNIHTHFKEAEKGLTSLLGNSLRNGRRNLLIFNRIVSYF